jgi:hypothetical protein
MLLLCAATQFNFTNEGDSMPREVLPRAPAQFGTGELRYASMGMFFVGAAMVSTSYFTPAAAENSQKIFEIPASKVRAMTPSEREQAKAYARQHEDGLRVSPPSASGSSGLDNNRSVHACTGAGFADMREKCPAFAGH